MCNNTALNTKTKGKEYTHVSYCNINKEYIILFKTSNVICILDCTLHAYLLMVQTLLHIKEDFKVYFKKGSFTKTGKTVLNLSNSIMESLLQRDSFV